MDFINRKDAIERFDTFLGLESPEWILSFYGLRGVGKTALLEQLRKTLSVDWASAWINFKRPSYRTYHHAVLQALIEPLRRRNLPAEAWAAYERRKEEIEDSRLLVARQSINADNSSTINKPVQNLTVNVGQELAAKYQEAKHEQARAWLDLVQHLDGKLIIFLDHWDALREHSPVEFRAWVVEGLLLDGHKRLPKLRVVVASHRSLRSDRLLTEVIPKEDIASEELGPLNRDDAIELMRQQDVEDTDFHNAVLDRVGGHPGLINLAVTLWREQPDLDLSTLTQDLDSEAASEWFLGELVENMKDNRSRRVLERGVILKRWILDTLDTVCECDGLDLRWFREFESYPFVQDSGSRLGFKEFIDLVREIRIRQIWQQRRPLFRRLHKNALKWYTDTDRMVIGT